MFHKTLFSGLILGVAALGMVFHHFSQTSTLLNKYQKFGLIKSDLRYEKVEKSWGSQGLIFYKVQFPFVNVPISSDQMNISLSDQGMNLKLKNANIKVTEGLKKIYGSKIAENLNTYVPYKDFMENILTSMAVMGINEFAGDISVNTLYSDAKTMNFKVDMTQKNQPTLQVNGVIHIPVVGAHQISDLWNGKIDSAEVKLKDSFLKRYINYANSKKIPLPKSLKKGILYFKDKSAILPQLKKIWE